jgi:hypothetical protein
LFVLTLFLFSPALPLSISPLRVQTSKAT